jgi:DNA repair exonuclease SbcCD ATPase subunit
MEDDFPEFAEATLKWLKAKYGDRLKSVVVHDDEPHPHLHFTVIPRKGERLDDIHEGLKAKSEAKKNNQKGKAQNLAYIGAMRKLQDDFYEKVAMRSGLTRLGPARTRDTRSVWQAKQQEAEALAKKLKAIEDAKKVASSGYRAGVKKGVQEAQAQAVEIVAQAQKKAKGLGNWFAGLASGWHEPSAKAKAEATKVKAEAQKAQEEAQKALEDAEKVKAKAKKEADQRVANVANQLTEERTKTKDLESELKKEQDRANDLAKRLALYEKNQLSNGQKFKK